MSVKLTARLNSDDFSVVYVARAVRNDYGVRGSPVWYEPEDIEILSFEFCGRDVPLRGLPDAIESALLELSEGLEWEPE